MRLISLLSFLILAVSCASVSNSLELEKRIAAEEVRSLKEIKIHSQLLLESHPEIKESNKLILAEKIKTLSKSDQSSYSNVSRSSLEEELKSNYESKYKNIYSLVSLISEMSLKHETSSEFDQDISLLIREIR